VLFRYGIEQGVSPLARFEGSYPTRIGQDKVLRVLYSVRHLGILEVDYKRVEELHSVPRAIRLKGEGGDESLALAESPRAVVVPGDRGYGVLNELRSNSRESVPIPPIKEGDLGELAKGIERATELLRKKSDQERVSVFIPVVDDVVSSSMDRETVIGVVQRMNQAAKDVLSMPGRIFVFRTRSTESLVFQA